MKMFRESRIDCIVADYQMPGVDGIQFLERIRESRPQLPFLLVTSQGSERVAERAIGAGVTDYLTKDLGIEQARQFASSIQAATENYRLQCALAESEERYRTVTEQSRDAVAMLQDGQLLFCNRRLSEVTGRQREQLRESRDIIAEIVHRDDQAQVRAAVTDWNESRDSDGTERTDDGRLHGARIVQPDGTVRHCEFTGRQIGYDGETVTLVSIRDVTDRQRRERELRWERELNRTVQEALVESRNRESLEQTVTEQLQCHGYALAWIGEQISDELAPRVVGGDRRYVETIDRTVPGGAEDRAVKDSGESSEPTVHAARTGAAQFVQQFTDFAGTEWSDTATEYHYRSGAGIPLVYDGIPYGVLGVYADEADRFDETERRLLGALADTVAFAIHSLETRESLAADSVVAVTVQIEDGYYLLDLARDGTFADCESVRVRGTLPVEDERVLQYLEIAGGDTSAVREQIANHVTVRDAEVVSETEPSRVQVTISGSVPEAALSTRGGVVRSTSIGTASARIEVELPKKDDIRDTVSQLDDRYGTVSVQSVIERERFGEDGASHTLGTTDITRKQLNALQVAYYEGYFEQPRENSATDIAESLGTTHSTFLRHLRAAHRKILAEHFE
jgi:PAS domain S-box-containing protein